jgi:type IV fimbrial biogenesis protein FimT
MRTPLRRGSGFTLIELMMTIAIVAVVGSLAAPSFANILYDSTRTNAVNAFVHTVFLARSEAMMRGTIVSVCSSADGTTCDRAGADWSRGWIAFVNDDRDEPPVHDDNEQVVLVQGPWKQGRISANRTAFSFRPYQQAVVNGTIVFCDPRGDVHARAVIINAMGRPRVSQRDGSNRPLTCARF